MPRISIKKSAQAVNGLTNQTRVMKLRSQGKLFREIASELGITNRAVFYCMARGMSQLQAESKEAASGYRDEQWGLCQGLLEKWYPLAADGDGDALEYVLKIFARMARLRGLDLQPDDVVNNGTPWTILTSEQRCQQLQSRLEEIHRIKNGLPVEVRFENSELNEATNEATNEVPQSQQSQQPRKGTTEWDAEQKSSLNPVNLF